MITLRDSQRAHRRALPARRPGRPRHFAPSCEFLESRQLLSVSAFPAGPTVGALPASLAVQPSVSITPIANPGTPAGLSPAQVKAAYGVNQVTFNGSVSGNGAGQTIAIVDAYDDPNIASDLAKFDSQYGLSAPASFTQYVQSGLQADNAAWALETALDVEWAHAIAPAASIDLIEAAPDTTDLFGAVGLASSLPGVSVVSMSFGLGEFPGETAYDGVFTTPSGHDGVAFVASSGDSSTVQYPSSSPNVLAVGGTTLNANGNGSYISETAWNGTGGGTSAYEPGRTTPDVAWDANPSTGVAVYDSVGTGNTPWQVVGGTSVGAPSWSGLIAIADQGLAMAGRGPLTNAQLSANLDSSASRSDFNAIVGGNSGLGSPRANLLIPALVAGVGSGAVPISSSGGHSHIAIPVAPQDDYPISPPSTTTTGSGSSSTTGSSSSIAPLTPTILAAYSFRGRQTIVVIVVPQPLVANLGPSGTPVTTQAILATAAAEEAPTTSTHFGQGGINDSIEPDLGQPTRVEPRGPAGIDVIEPFQPEAPKEAPEEGPPPRLKDARTRPGRAISEAGLDAGLELTDWSPLPGSPLKAVSSSDDRAEEARASWAPSTMMFGAAAVALGGYQLAMRQSDRFSGRWVPGRSKSRRPAGRPAPVANR
ncbi:MAG: S8 family serine peptidase [Isosphaeraceae bacterium]